MAEFTDLSGTDASNTGRFPEGQAPSTVNNGARALEGLLARGFGDTIIPSKTTGGSSNAQTLSPNQTVADITTCKSLFIWKAGYTNTTAAMTLNISDAASTGALSVKTTDGSDPGAGAVVAGGFYISICDGTNIVLLNQSNLSAITTRGDVIVGNSSGVGDRLAVGTSGQFITTDGTDVSWGDAPGAIQGGHKNLKIVTADGGTGVVITADQITVENSAGYSMRLSSLNVTLDFTGTGAGKLDAGTIATSTFYFIWAIAKDDGTKSAVGSTSSSAPAMPTDYTHKSMIGAVLTKSGSAVFYGSNQYGNTVQYTAPPTLCTGAQGTWTSAWSSSISVAGFVPTAIASEIDIIAAPTGASSNIMVAPNASYNLTLNALPPAPIIATTTAPYSRRIILEGTGVFVSSQVSTAVLVLGYKMNL